MSRRRPVDELDLGLRDRLLLESILSGGQTGVDRAALDVALELGIPHGGWCPSGRRAEDGVIPEKYRMWENESDSYADRTRRNIIDSDGTLLLYGRRLEGGSLLTARLALSLGKPCYRVGLTGQVSYLACLDWLVQHRVRRLNVAGPRASKEPQIYAQAHRFLRLLLA